jgi:hypothetical protein
MSDQFKTQGGGSPHIVTVDEWQILQGRLAALEVLAAQSVVTMLRLVKDEHREFVIGEGMMYLENEIFPRLEPLSQRVALERMEAISSAGLATVRQVKD